eukprot:196426-Hanusia_phi.AAC.3
MSCIGEQRQRRVKLLDEEKRPGEREEEGGTRRDRKRRDLEGREGDGAGGVITACQGRLLRSLC